MRRIRDIGLVCGFLLIAGAVDLGIPRCLACPPSCGVLNAQEQEPAKDDTAALQAQVKQLKLEKAQSNLEKAQLKVNLLIAQSAMQQLSAQLVQFMTAEPKATEKPTEAENKKDQP